MTASDPSSESTDQAARSDSTVSESSRDARERLEQHYRDIEQTYGDTRARLEEFNERAADFIRENPGVCIVGAVAAGYLVGRLASRRWLT